MTGRDFLDTIQCEARNLKPLSANEPPKRRPSSKGEHPGERLGKLDRRGVARSWARAFWAGLPCLLHRKSTQFNMQDSPNMIPARNPPAAVERGGAGARERVEGSGRRRADDTTAV